MIFSKNIISDIIANNKNIHSVRFFSFSTATKLQDRLTNLNQIELEIIQKAKNRKSKDGISFWDAMLSLFAEEGITHEKILSEVLYHQANSNYDYVSRNDIEQFLRIRREESLAINSKVIIDNGISRHIPLLDFKLPVSISNNNLAKACIRVLGLKGYLLESGRSYHFIGNGLMSESELLDLLAKFALLSPISDKAWVSHQIIERSASLRITAKDGKEPCLVTEC